MNDEPALNESSQLWGLLNQDHNRELLEQCRLEILSEKCVECGSNPYSRTTGDLSCSYCDEESYYDEA